MNYIIKGHAKDIAEAYAGQVIHAHPRIKDDDRTIEDAHLARFCSGVVIGYSAGTIWLKQVEYRESINDRRGFWLDKTKHIMLTINKIDRYEIIDGIISSMFVLKSSINKNEIEELIKKLEL